MFKKKVITQANVYDNKWNEIIESRFNIMRSIDDLYADIQYSLNVLSCFEENHPNWNEEKKNLKDLRYKMLCKCGAYDGTNVELNDLWNKHKNNLQPNYCLNYTSLDTYPLKDCNHYLRNVAKRFIQYGR